MKNIPIRDFETERLLIKVPTMKEQYDLWNIIRDENINRYYFPTPDAIFRNNNLSKDNIEDLKEARRIFLEKLNNWEKQKPYFERKIEGIHNGDNSQKFTWSVFLKSGEVIGQITVQPNEAYPDNPEVRDIGWFIKPCYQRQGYGKELATAVLDFMFNEVEIDRIETSAATINPGSWGLMERLGFVRTGEKISTYYDPDDKILSCYCYTGDKEKFLKRSNARCKKI